MTHHRDHMWGDAIGSTYGATIEQRLREAEGWQAELEALQDDDPASVRRARFIGVAACLASITGAAATLLWLGNLFWQAWGARLAELAAETISFFLLIAAIVAAFIVFSPSEAQAAPRDALTDPTFWSYFAGGVGVVYVAVIALYTVILIRENRE